MAGGNPLGKMLLTGAAIMTAVAPIRADWNDSHIFSDRWSPHARFHGVVSVLAANVLAATSLWLLWRRSTDRRATMAAAALVPISYWGAFFPAALVPGTGVDDPGHRVGRLAGIPINLVAAGGATAAAALGWYLEWHGDAA